ncbi:Uncharacterized [Moorella glycerini]|uniref:Uncharacterized protein n=1 Tax=Neomoorella stamsii TaxID=1266720 RepID=A0A9X7J3Q4_9FIRM|nr:hypothetical protein MOST_16420 [Moorella stamsii]CEP68093.1 Uncharacterized [Moorella glycerini]
MKYYSLIDKVYLSYTATNDICHLTKIPLHLRQEGLLAPLVVGGGQPEFGLHCAVPPDGPPKKGGMLDGSSSSKRKPK